MKSISPYYHRHPKVIVGKGAIHTLKDVLLEVSSTTPLYIHAHTPRIEKKVTSLHASISSSPFIHYSEDNEIDITTVDAIIAYGGSDEIVLCDHVASLMKRNVPIIHIPFGDLKGDEYTHCKGSSDVIIYDWDLCKDLKMPHIGSMMSVMLLYLFASSLEHPSSFTYPSLSFILTTAHAMIEAEREEKSFMATTLIHVVGDVASHAEHSSLSSLMEHLEITSLSTLSQSAATLLLPLVRFVKQTKPTLYKNIEESLEGFDVEEFCSYWVSHSPLEGLEGILREVILNMYNLLEPEESSLTLHTFLTSLKEERI